MKNVCVIVVNWNGRKYLENCIAGLRKQTFKHFTIAVVDNGSTDGSCAYLNQHCPDVVLHKLTKNYGFSFANNYAIRRSQSEFIALLNNDAIPQIHWLENLMRAMQQFSHAGSAASKMLFYHDPQQIDRAGDAYTQSGTGLLRGRGEPTHKYSQRELIFGACAGAALYRRAMLNKIGLFDEDFFLDRKSTRLNSSHYS